MSSFLIEYLKRQARWSEKTFGSSKRTIGITEHIKSEIEEIRADPEDCDEWIDVIILGLDGFWRCGGNINLIEKKLLNKQQINFRRKYAYTPPDKPSFHLRGDDEKSRS